jgi:hypothetical protein
MNSISYSPNNPLMLDDDLSKFQPGLSLLIGKTSRVRIDYIEVVFYTQSFHFDGQNFQLTANVIDQRPTHVVQIANDLTNEERHAALENKADVKTGRFCVVQWIFGKNRVLLLITYQRLEVE